MNKTADFKNVIACREKLSPFRIAQWTKGLGKRADEPARLITRADMKAWVVAR